MKKIVGIKHLLTISLLVLAGCEGSVEGDVFIVKGSGDIAVSPGRTISFIPIESEEALFKEAAVRGAETAVSLIQADLAKLCPEMLPRAKDGLADLLSQEAEIQSRGSIPTDGCSGLVAERDQLENAASSVRETQSSEINRLESELNAAKQVRSTAIANRALELKNAELEKIMISFRNEGSDLFIGARWSITNESDYCVGTGPVEVNLLASDAETHITSKGMRLQPLKDRYGFVMGSCAMQKGSTITEEVRRSDLDTDPARITKAISDGKIRTHKCGSENYKENCVSVGAVEVTSEFAFYTVSRVESGADVTYTTSPVNWQTLALKSMDLSSYDSRIATAERSLKDAQAKNSEDTSVASANAASRRASECEDDTAKLTEIHPVIDSVRDSIAQISECAGELKQVASGLASVNNVLGLELEVPDVKQPYREAFMLDVLEKFTASEVIKTDTNIQGHYTIPELSPGKYLVFGEYADNFVNGFWLDAVEVESGEQVIDLNQNTFVSVDFLSYLDAAASSCETCISGDEPIPSRSSLASLVTAEQEALDELQEQLEEQLEELQRLLR